MQALVGGAALSLLEGVESAVDEVRPLWPKALDAGIVTMPFDLLQPTIVAHITRRPVRKPQRSFDATTDAFLEQQLQDAKGALVERKLSQLLGLQEQFDQAAAALLRRTLERGRQQGKTDAELLQLLRGAADQFGLAGWGTGTARTAGMADTYFTGTLLGVYQPTHRGALASPVLVPATPYSRYRTMQDERVRHRHSLLDGFVARSSWGGWAFLQPPNGWNCRCWIVPVAYTEAQAGGWTADIPTTEAIAQLDAFLAAGGPDESFPKADFLGLALAA